MILDSAYLLEIGCFNPYPNFHKDIVRFGASETCKFKLLPSWVFVLDWARKIYVTTQSYGSPSSFLEG